MISLQALRIQWSALEFLSQTSPPLCWVSLASSQDRCTSELLHQLIWKHGDSRENARLLFHFQTPVLVWVLLEAGAKTRLDMQEVYQGKCQ